MAYEAHEHGWLSTGSKNDYVAADQFFSILQSHGVEFYGAELADTDSDYGYDAEYSDEDVNGYDDENDVSVPV